jgi:hypothetical protein
MEEDLPFFEDTHFWGITLLLITHLGPPACLSDPFLYKVGDQDETQC